MTIQFVLLIMAASLAVGGAFGVLLATAFTGPRPAEPRTRPAGGRHRIR